MQRSLARMVRSTGRSIVMPSRLVSRPLAMPNNQMGVLTKVGVHNDISMRVAMQYDIDAGGTKVNLDLLCGVAVLEQRLCVPLLG